MKFVSVRELLGRPGKVWKDLASEGDLVLTARGKPIALLSTIEDRTLEERLRTLRRARPLDAVTRLQAAAARRRPWSASAVASEIAAARSKRPR